MSFAEAAAAAEGALVLAEVCAELEEASPVDAAATSLSLLLLLLSFSLKGAAVHGVTRKNGCSC